MTVKTRLQLRHDTAANWTAANPTLRAGEPGVETDTGRFKLGDGSTAWNSLAYAAASYTADETTVHLAGSTFSVKDGGITSAKIADATIATADLADSSVTSAKIADATIVAADLSATAAVALSQLATQADGTFVANESGATAVPSAMTFVDLASRQELAGAFDASGAASAAQTAAEGYADNGDNLRYLRRGEVAATTGSGTVQLSVVVQNNYVVTDGFTSTTGAAGTAKIAKSANGYQPGDKVTVTSNGTTKDETGGGGASLNGQSFYIGTNSTATNLFLCRTYALAVAGTSIAFQGGTESNIKLTRADPNINSWVLWHDWFTVNPSKVLSATYTSAASGTYTYTFDLPPGVTVGGVTGTFWVAGITPSAYNNSTTGWKVATVSSDGLTVTTTGTANSTTLANPSGSYSATNTDTNTGSIYLWQGLLNDIAAGAAQSPAKTAILSVPAGSATPFWVANVEVRANAVRSVFGAGDTANHKAHYSDVPIPWNVADPTTAGYYANAYGQMLTNLKAAVVAASLYSSIWGVHAGAITRDTIEARVPNQQSLVTLTNLTHFCLGVSWTSGSPTLNAAVSKPFISSDVGSIVWGSSSTPASNGIPSGATITAVAADGSTATMSANATSTFVVPATTQLSLKRDVTGLGYTNSNCAMDWLYLAGAKNVVGTSRYGKYSLVAAGGCATVVGTDGTGYTTAKLGSKAGVTGAWDVFLSQLTTTFPTAGAGENKKLLGTYVLNKGFPNIQHDTATGAYRVVSGDEDKSNPGTRLTASGDDQQWTVIVDKACVAYGARGTHMQQALNDTVTYAYWSNGASGSVQTHFAPSSTSDHTTSTVGFQFGEAQYETCPDPDAPSPGTSYLTAVDHAKNSWGAVYLELWPPMPGAYEAYTAQASTAALQGERTNVLDCTSTANTYVLPSGSADKTAIGVILKAGSTHNATINDTHSATVIVLTPTVNGAELQYDLASDTWFVGAVATSDALLTSRFLPLTTEGDLYYYHSSAPARLALGTTWQQLGVNAAGTTVAWNRPTATWSANDHGLLFCSVNDPGNMTNTATPTAGKATYTRCWVPYTCTVASLAYNVSTAGSGAQLPVNCFIGLFNSSGTRLGVSADQSTAMQSNGNKTAALTVDGGQSLTITGGPSVYVYIGLLIGTQSTTNVVLRGNGSGASSNFNFAASAPVRSFQAGSGLTALPTSVTPGTTFDMIFLVGAV